MKVDFKRMSCNKSCYSCGDIIQEEAPAFVISFPNECFILCKDCGNDMQNDMANEYSKFVDLKK